MSAAATANGRFRTVLEMIKFEHSVFALPFALTGALLAARFTAHGWPTWKQLLWIVVAMVSARALIVANEPDSTQAGRKPHFAMTRRRPLPLAVMMATSCEGATL